MAFCRELNLERVTLHIVQVSAPKLRSLKAMVTAIDWQWHQGDYSVYTKPLEKSANDQREYRLLKLANELQVLLVSDPDADRASASLDVHVGSLSDPVKMTMFFLLPFFGKREKKENALRV